MYLFHNADGLSTEGIGAIAQYQIHTYTLSKLLGVEFASTDFVNIQHYQGNSTQDKFGKDITKFFNFPNKVNLNNKDIVSFESIDQKLIDFVNQNKTKKDLFVEVKKKDIMKFADKNYKLWGSLVKELSPCISFDSDRYYFDDDKLNISLHVRNFITGRDNDTSPSREYFSKDKRVDYYTNLLKKFNSIFSKNNKTKSLKKEYHIYSRSEVPDDMSQFECFTELELPIKFHINEHPLISLYHLIKSDIRVVSNSSFSYLAALYGDGLSIVRDNFHHKIPNNVIYSDYNGNFDESLMNFEDN